LTPLAKEKFPSRVSFSAQGLVYTSYFNKCKVVTGKKTGEIVLHRLEFHHAFEDTSGIYTSAVSSACYAMTINKSQGQTFTGTVVLYLKTDVFAHGQLYVAGSFVRSFGF
jgi:hypothetical protein